MRLKLVIIASLIASVVGAGSAIAIILWVFSSLKPNTPGLIAFACYLLPVLTIFLAAMFVYRHTARRRKLQAALTALISVALTLAIFVFASLYTAHKEGVPPGPATPPANVSRLY